MRELLYEQLDSDIIETETDKHLIISWIISEMKDNKKLVEEFAKICSNN